MIKQTTSALGIILGITLSMTGCNKGENTDSGNLPTNAADSFSYAYGIIIHNELSTNDLEVNADMMTEGMNSAADSSAVMDLQQAQNYLQTSFRAMQEKKAKAKAEAFLAANRQKEGVIETESGLQYMVIKEGSGPNPGFADKVKVHYHGTLTDGKVFDSSVERGEPVEFGVSQVIPGWTEALQLMSKGAKWKLFIPPNIAYGARGNRGIPPHSALIFEVEILEIIPAQ